MLPYHGPGCTCRGLFWDELHVLRYRDTEADTKLTFFLFHNHHNPALNTPRTTTATTGPAITPGLTLDPPPDPPEDSSAGKHWICGHCVHVLFPPTRTRSRSVSVVSSGNPGGPSDHSPTGQHAILVGPAIAARRLAGTRDARSSVPWAAKLGTRGSGVGPARVRKRSSTTHRKVDV